MSALIGNPLLLPDEGYNISRSVRLRSSASAYFNKTNSSSPTDSRKWTWSGWVKRGSLSATQNLLSQANSGSDDSYLQFGSSDKLVLGSYSGAGTDYGILTSGLFRDPSAWYHIVAVLDTANATAADRGILYVNGVRQTVTNSANGVWPQNSTNNKINTASQVVNIGRRPLGDTYFDGYLTEVNFVDGQALTPSSFGETDAITGVWKPKKYTGTYGTNGFFLNFSDNSSNTATTIGKDSSGNGNNWTPNNISVTSGSTYDSMLDVPTLWADGGNGRGNYCVMNPLDSRNITNTFTLNGNLGVNNPSTGTNDLMRATFMIPSGKWYWEATLTSGSSYWGACIIRENSALAYTSLNSGDAYAYSNNGTKNNGQTSTSYGNTYTAGDVVMVAFDAASGKIWFGKNGTWQASGDPVAATNEAFSGISGNYFPGVLINTSVVNFNFGQRPFAYTPPSGFRAMHTGNLPEPVIKKPNQWMDVSTWTGNGSARSITNSGSMQPDLVWVKSRTQAIAHRLVDAVRGAGNTLASNLTNAEFSDPQGVTSFNSNGFSLGTDTSYNQNADTYVGWQWKEGATPGFDIVTYTGTGANRTVAHSLGVYPSMMIIKNRSNAYNWAVYHGSLGSGATKYLQLNSTGAAGTSSTYWNNTEPNSANFTVGTSGDVNLSSNNYVAYLFAEVAGFSKFGSYTGNGSTDGPFVFTGFRPKFILTHRTDGSGSNWIIFDTSRSPYNPAALALLPNLSNSEAAEDPVDLLSNGFKIRATGNAFNTNGGTYIFAAFAENPFKYALAR